jgi:tetratricopeptide (TPR) repeat protein
VTRSGRVARGSAPFVVVFSMAASVADAQPRANPVADAMWYWELVQGYARGDSDDDALEKIVAWEPHVVTGVIAQVEEASHAGSNKTVQVRAILAAFPAAVMLHTEAGLLLSWQEDSNGAGLQWSYAQRLAELHPSTREQAEFLRAWYQSFGLFCLGSYGVDNATVVLERGVARFPDDERLGLALGTVYEARGMFWRGRVPSLEPNLSSEARRELQRAESLYRDVLVRDPSHGEARLRLGRCLAIREGGETALPELRRVESGTEDARLLYLSRLFAGELLRREGRLPEAHRELSRAVEAWPAGQAAALSLAELLHTMGDRSEAASVLQAAIAGPESADPFRTYSFGDRAEHKRLLEATRSLAKASVR